MTSTSKELSQVEEILDGKRRYKFLDPNRKEVLTLPPCAFKLWMAYWMLETDNREAYPSLDTLERITQMDRKTILKQREYLLKTGWLIRLTGTAAERYSKPTRGSHDVAIYRAVDPTKGGKFPPLEQKSGNVGGVKFPPKVCSCCCSCPCTCIDVTLGVDTVLKLKPECGDDSLRVPSLRDTEEQNPKQLQGQEQRQKPSRSTSADKWLGNYDSPKPDKFDTWSQESRAKWVVDHKRKVLPVPAEVKPTREPSVPPVEDTPVPAKVVPATPPVTVPVPSASPRPPSSVPPPKPAEPVDYRLEWMKMLAKEIYTLQTCFNGKVKPPTDWEITWLPDMDALVKLTESKGSMGGWMLTDVIALSQVRYAAKYATPAAMLADVVVIGREVVELRIQGRFEEIKDAYITVVRPPEHQSADKDELDDEPMYVDPEVKAVLEQKQLAKYITRWKTWLDGNTPQESIPRKLQTRN